MTKENANKPDISKSACLGNLRPIVLKAHSVDYLILVFRESGTYSFKVPGIFKKFNVISVCLKEVTIGLLINLGQNKEFHYKVVKWSG